MTANRLDKAIPRQGHRPRSVPAALAGGVAIVVLAVLAALASGSAGEEEIMAPGVLDGSRPGVESCPPVAASTTVDHTAGDTAPDRPVSGCA